MDESARQDAEARAALERELRKEEEPYLSDVLPMIRRKDVDVIVAIAKIRRVGVEP